MTLSRTIILVYGRTGSGKSYYTKQLIKSYDRVIVIDKKFEYDGLIVFTIEDLLEFHAVNEPENFRYICRFKDELDIEYLFKFCDVVGNLLLVVEECGTYISPRSHSSYFSHLVKTGRHSQVSIIGTARRPSELSAEFKADVDKIISFKQTLPLDLQIMKGQGFEGLDKLGEYDYMEINY